MIEKFYPDYMFDKVENIPISLLESQRIKGIMFDMDNTLVGSKYKYTKECKIWVKELKNKGIKMCIFSNTPKKKKVEKIAKDFGFKYIHNGFKPFKSGFKKAEKILEIDKENIVIVGDQLFTDILGGNLYGIKTILVKPIDSKEFIGTKIKRPLENSIIKKYKKSEKYKRSLERIN